MIVQHSSTVTVIAAVSAQIYVQPYIRASKQPTGDPFAALKPLAKRTCSCLNLLSMLATIEAMMGSDCATWRLQILLLDAHFVARTESLLACLLAHRNRRLDLLPGTAGFKDLRSSTKIYHELDLLVTLATCSFRLALWLARVPLQARVSKCDAKLPSRDQKMS